MHARTHARTPIINKSSGGVEVPRYQHTALRFAVRLLARSDVQSAVCRPATRHRRPFRRPTDITEPSSLVSSMCRGRRCSMAASLEDLKSPLFWRATFAELVGTLVLVLVGTGSCVNWKLQEGEPSVVQISLCFGLAVATMVWCIAHLSGGHINPAVTIALLVTRKISLVRAMFFVIAQCAGAVIGSGALKGLTPPSVQGGLGATTVSGELTQAQGFGVEFVATFVLVTVVFASCDAKRTDLGGSAPLAVGLSVTLCHLFAIRYTGSSMNPARSFGPAVITGRWHEHWVYWCGPVLGGIVAGLLYDNLFASNASLTKAKGYLLTSRYDPEEFEPEKERKTKLEEGEETL